MADRNDRFALRCTASCGFWWLVILVRATPHEDRTQKTPAMSDKPDQRSASPWKGGDFALPMVLLMPAASIASICGSQAAQLGITGASLVMVSPVLMLAVAVFCPLFLFCTR